MVHRSETEREIQELADIRAGIPPGDMAAEKRRVVLKNKGLIYRDQSRPWEWHLTPAGERA